MASFEHIMKILKQCTFQLVNNTPNNNKSNRALHGTYIKVIESMLHACLLCIVPWKSIAILCQICQKLNYKIIS